MATQRDYYDILGVPRGADDDDIKRAFRKQAQQWHPDVNTSTEADVRFKEINEAYQVLSDPQRRQAYDMFGHAAAGGRWWRTGFRSIWGRWRRVPGWLPGLRRPLRHAVRRRRGDRAPAPRPDRRGPSLRPAADLRRVDRRRREGDRVREPGDLRDVRRQRRRARHLSSQLPEVQWLGRAPHGPPDDARPDDQRHAVRPVPRHGQDRPHAVPHLPRRRPSPSEAQPARHRAGGHRRRPPDQDFG